MRVGPSLVIQSALLLCLLLATLGFLVSPAKGQDTVAYTPLVQHGAPSEGAGDPVTIAPQQATGGAPAIVQGCAVSLEFPMSILQWCDLITTHAQNNQLDPDLVAAVILQESGGDPQAYSRSGAVGLMQVMPRDGLAARFKCVNGPCFAKRPTIAELEDPAFNVGYGTRLLAGLIAREGSNRDGLKAYGPMDVGYRYADAVMVIWERLSR